MKKINLNLLLVILFSFLLEMPTAYAVNPKTPIKKDKQLLIFEATSQTIFQGRKETNPMQEFLMLAKWQQTYAASEFYFKSNTIWRVVRVRKINHYNNKLPAQPNDAVIGSSYYNAHQLLTDSIAKNDSIELYPMPNGRYKIPHFFNKLPKQCIVYYHNFVWYYTPIQFKQLPTVITP